MIRDLFQAHMYGWLPPLAEAEPRWSAPHPLPEGSWREGTLDLGPVEMRFLLAEPNVEPKGLIAGVSFEPIAEIAANSESRSWPLASLTSAGYAVAIYCHADVCPDDPTLATERLRQIQPGHPLGAIGAWAWGLASMSKSLNRARTIYVGHSRMGKTALVAGALYGGAAAVIPIQSGCGGAAPSRTEVGETVGDITRVFPHWFAPRFAEYAGHEDLLPFEQSDLISLCAPASVFLPNAEEDIWANPDGQKAMLEAATAVQDGKSAWWIRPGRHAVTDEDWTAILRWLGSLSA